MVSAFDWPDTGYQKRPDILRSETTTGSKNVNALFKIKKPKWVSGRPFVGKIMLLSFIKAGSLSLGDKDFEVGYNFCGSCKFRSNLILFWNNILLPSESRLEIVTLC